MKVRYTFAVRGLLRTRHSEPVKLHGWEFSFNCSDDGFIDRLWVDITNVPKDEWPTLNPVDPAPGHTRPQFPFETNPNAIRFSDFHSKIVNLESLLSVFGLTSIDFSTMKEEWICDPDDDMDLMIQGWERSPAEHQALTEPLAHEELARCIVASAQDSATTAALAHFRLGQEHILNLRYLESFRHSFFYLEHEFGQGEYRTKQLKRNFREACLLRDSIESTLLCVDNKAALKVQQLRSVVQKSANLVDGFIEHFVDLRGELSHASHHLMKKWHPSRDRDFENDAICIMNVAEDIAFKRVQELMRIVPLSPKDERAE